MSSAGQSLLVFLLSALSVGGLLYAVFVPRFRQQARVRKRLWLAAGTPAETPRQAAAGNSRRRSIEETLKHMEQKQKEKGRSSSSPSFTERLRQSGLGWSKTTYLGVCVSIGLVGHVLLDLGFGLGSAAAAVGSVMMALLLPHLYVGRKRKRRLSAFRNELPNAVDVIVRGVRSGLPLGDCLRLIAAEAQEPVRSEFKAAVDEQTLGVPLPDAMLRLADRVPVPEASFLATVITIQSRSGGNLTEALANLSSLLRERKKMRGKIQALSSEAKASAGIIGSLPPVVALLLYLTSPQYISLLFTTTTGQVVLAGCAVWMSIGIMVMSAMINFDF